MTKNNGEIELHIYRTFLKYGNFLDSGSFYQIVRIPSLPHV